MWKCVYFLLGSLVRLCLISQFALVSLATMSGSSGCGGLGFYVVDLPVELFGVPDVVAAERARRARFLLRRLDPEYLEVISAPSAPAAGPELLPPVPQPVLRRSRRVLGLEAKFEEILPDPRRRRVK